MSEKNANTITKKYEDENRRSAMAKRMAEEEQRRNDINVKHWNGIQSNKVYWLSIGGKRWADRGTGGRIIFVLGVIAALIVIGILIYTAVRAFQLPAVQPIPRQ